MRIVIHQIAVFEGARLGFVGIHRQIMRPLLFLGDERPFLPRREPRPAAAAKAGIDDDLDDVVGLHVQRFFSAA